MTIPNSVTNIGKEAFNFCRGLISVTIPSSVTTIGKDAFRDCSSLASVTIDIEDPLAIDETTFSNRANATLYVPAGCKTAYEAANYWKEFKEIVEMPATSPAIVFADAKVKALCVSNWDTDGDGELSEDEAAAVTDLGEVFKKNTEITQFNELRYFTGLTAIGEYAFEECSALKSVTLPDGLETIGEGAFTKTGLESIKFPSSLTLIQGDAFHTSQLKSIDFGDGNITVDGNCFVWCGQLEEVYIPKNVKLRGFFGFGCCEKLRKVVFEQGNESELYYTFWGAYIDSNLEEAVLPSASNMVEGTFAECRKLQKVTFLDGDAGWHFYADNFEEAADDILFVIPDDTAESFLKRGYRNLSDNDKSGLDWLKEEFEAEATRIEAMAANIESGDKDALAAAISTARQAVETADDYLPVLQQIDNVKAAAMAFVGSATLTGKTDITAAAIINPDLDRSAIGWYESPIRGEYNYGWIDSNYEGENGVKIDHFIESWMYAEQGTLGNGEMSQTIKNLSAGKYRLEADVIAQRKGEEVTGVTLFVGDQQTPVSTLNNAPRHYSVDVLIGLKTQDTNANWIAADNFRLYSLNDEQEEEDDYVTPIADLANAIYVEPQNAVAGATMELAVKLKNAETVTSYGFVLELPDGFSIATTDNNSFDDEVTLSDRHKGHSLTTNKLDGNKYKLAVASLSSKVLTDNDGQVMVIKVHVEEGLPLGSYGIYVREPLIVRTDGVKLATQEVRSLLTIREFLDGDVDGDGTVDMADAVLVINHYAGKPVSNFVEAAADVDGDGAIDLADAVRIINFYVGKTTALSRSKTAKAGQKLDPQ